MDNRQGDQPLRNMSAFGAQPGRSTAQMGSGRLPNGNKMAAPQGNWAYGGMQNGAPGLPPASRTPLGGTSFAQSLGGGSSANNPLDQSDFPSLTNTSSSGFPNPNSQASQAVWSNAARTHAPPAAAAGGMGLFTGRLTGHQDDGRSRHGQNEGGPSAVGARVSGNGVTGGLGGDDNSIGQEASIPMGNPPAMEEFPPLGGLGSSDLGQDRRVNMMQNAANNGVSASGVRQQIHEDLEQNSSPVSNSQSTSLDSMLQDGTSDPLGTGSGTSGRSRRDPFMDKYGLPELLRRVRSDDPNVQVLAIGHDLTGLGLDLSSNEPLWPIWGGPFGTGPARPMTPEFQLPSCYKVNNVRPLQDKITNFNTETLFIIFYQMPKDVAQEYAAYELTNRNWRFHKIQRAWFSRAPGSPAPVQMPDGERGVYEFFHFTMMRRESRQMYLKYAEMDDHIVPAGPFEPMMN